MWGAGGSGLTVACGSGRTVVGRAAALRSVRRRRLGRPWPGRRRFGRLGRWWDRWRQLGWYRRLGKPAQRDPTREHRRPSASLGTNQVSPTYFRGHGIARVLLNHSLSGEKAPHPLSVPYGAVAISASKNRKSGPPVSSGCSCSTTLPRAPRTRSILPARRACELGPVGAAPCGEGRAGAKAESQIRAQVDSAEQLWRSSIGKT